MNEKAVVVVSIEGVATDVGAAVYQKYTLVPYTCESLCKDAACETGADDQPIIHEHTH